MSARLHFDVRRHTSGEFSITLMADHNILIGTGASYSEAMIDLTENIDHACSILAEPDSALTPGGILRKRELKELFPWVWMNISKTK